MIARTEYTREGRSHDDLWKWTAAPDPRPQTPLRLPPLYEGEDRQTADGRTYTAYRLRPDLLPRVTTQRSA